MDQDAVQIGVSANHSKYPIWKPIRVVLRQEGEADENGKLTPLVEVAGASSDDTEGTIKVNGRMGELLSFNE